MSSLRKTSAPYRWPIENSNLAKCNSYLDGPVKTGRLILGKMDLFWSQEDEAKVIEMWAAGSHIADIAEAVNRDQDEIFLLLLELAKAGGITERDGGIYGKHELPGLIHCGRLSQGRKD